MKNYQKAIEGYSGAITLDPHYSEAYHQRGHSFLLSGDLDRAIADFSRCIELDPSQSKLYMDRAAVYELEHDHDNELRDLDMLIHLEPSHSLGHYRRSVIYLLRGDAAKAFADSIKNNLSQVFISVLYNNPWERSATENYDRAIADATQAIKLDQALAGAYHSRGHAYFGKGDSDLSITDLSRAIELDPKRSEFYVDRGDVYAYKGKNDKAIDDYSKAWGMAEDLAALKAASDKLAAMGLRIF